MLCNVDIEQMMNRLPVLYFCFKLKKHDKKFKWIILESCYQVLLMHLYILCTDEYDNMCIMFQNKDIITKFIISNFKFLEISSIE